MGRSRAGRTARAFAGGVALAVMMHAAAHAAQAPAADTTTTSSAAPATSLGEIIVTAQKRKENIEKTSIAITAVTADKIAQENIDQPQKLQFIVPSMTYGQTTGFTFLSLRGVGSDTAGLSDSSVATYEDGVYTGMQIGESVPTFDLQRIEVLRGPQGTLYGRNTDGGVINYITKDPSFEYAGVGEVSYGNYNSVETNDGVTGPIVPDKVAVRFSFHYNTHDGYYPNLDTGNSDYADRDIGGRISVLIKPTDNLSVIIRGDMSHDQNSDAYAMIQTIGLDGLSDDTHPLGLFSEPAAYFDSHPGLLSPSDIAKLNGGSIASYYGLMQAGLPAPNPLTTGTIANWAPTLFRTDTSGASVTVNWDAGPVTVKSISAYRYGYLLNRGEVGGMSFPLLYADPITQTEKQYTQEFNVSGKAFHNKLEWLAGAFFYHDDGVFSVTTYLPSFGQYLEANANLANPAGSAYAYNLNPAALTPLNNLPGVFPSPFQTAIQSGPAFPGDTAGSYVTAGSTIPSTAFEGDLQTQESNSYAGFFQATYHVTDALRVTGGFRYTIDRKDTQRIIHSNFAWDLVANTYYDYVQAGYLPASDYTATAIAAAAGVCDTHLSKTWSAPTGVIDVDYDVAPHVLTYAKVSWGYKAGGMNDSQCTGYYNPEYLRDYEGGVKAVLADGQALTNLAIYHYDYSNIQFLTTFNNTTEILNAGSATALGVEFEYALRPRFAQGWQLDGSVGFEDSHYGQGCFGDPADLNNASYLTTPLQACPASVTNPNTGQSVPIGTSADIKGNELIRAPRWKANIGLQYASDIAGGGNLTARVDAAWTDTIYNDIFNGKAPDLGQDTQPPYWIVNAQLVWTSPNKRYSAELFGENLSNSLYTNDRQAFNVPTTMYTIAGQLAAPRTYGVKITARFGPGVF